MKGILVLVAAMALAWASQADARDVRVRGYFKKDGTYVAPHYRSAPNRTTLDNYSTRGNYNPHTGQPGKVNPYAWPSEGRQRGAIQSTPPTAVYYSTNAPQIQGDTAPSDVTVVQANAAWPRWRAPTSIGAHAQNPDACSEFLIAADELSRAAQNLARCSSRMDPAQTCGYESADSATAAVRYQVAASVLQRSGLGCER